MNFAKTWWGEKWLDALKGVYWTNRIERGRRYANTGRVYDILIKDNLALAKVKGNYKSYYNVSVEFDEPTIDGEPLFPPPLKPPFDAA